MVELHRSFHDLILSRILLFVTFVLFCVCLFLFVAFRGVFRQGFDEEVEAQPQAPTVVIESNRENQCQYEEQDEDAFVISPHDQEEEEANQQDHKLGGDDVGQDCADKEAVFPLEKGHAVRTVMADLKRMVNNPGLTTRGTAQPQRPTHDLLELC